MATGTLTGQTIANTYKSLLKVTGTTAGGETLHATTLKVIEDGDGNPSPIQLAQNRIEIVPTANHANAFEVSQADGTQIFNINSTTPGLTLAGNATITTADNSDNLALVSTDTDENAGPNLSFWRNSANPANNDLLGQINWYAENDADEKTHMAQFYVTSMDVANASEDVRFVIQTILAGATETSRVELLPSETVINQDSKDIDFRVESDGNANMLVVDAGNNRVGIGTGSPDYNLEVQSSGTFSKIAQTVYRDSDKGNYLDMFFSRGTVGSPAVVQDNDELFTLRSFGYNADGTAFDQAGAMIFSVDGTPSSSSDSSDMPGRIEFWTTPDGTETPTEKMRITSNGTVQINNGLAYSMINNAGNGTLNGLWASGSDELVVGNDSGWDCIRFLPGSTEKMRITSGGAVCIARTSVLSPAAKLVVASAADGSTTPAASFQANTSTSSGAVVVFHSGDGSEAGSITLSNLNAADAVAYGTSSDYRLKEKVKTLPNGLDRVNQMKPVEYEWKKSKSKSEGFIAHELQEICDYAVTGEKDGDRMQQVDYAKITPILVKAVQELSAKVEALENA